MLRILTIPLWDTLNSSSAASPLYHRVAVLSWILCSFIALFLVIWRESCLQTHILPYFFVFFSPVSCDNSPTTQHIFPEQLKVYILLAL